MGIRLLFNETTARGVKDCIQKLPSLLQFKDKEFNVESPDAEEKDLLFQLLQIDPKARITASEALRHPYFSGIDEHQSIFNGNTKPTLLHVQPKDKRQKLK